MNSKNNDFEQELINLLSQRAKLFLETVQPVGANQTQKNAGLAELDALLNRLVELNQGPLSDPSVRAIARELTSGLLALKKP